MSKLSLVALLFSACLLLVACGNDDTQESSNDSASPSSSAPATEEIAIVPTVTYDEETVTAGKLAFNVYCVACHGPTAEGIEGLGVNLVESEFVHTHTDDELLAFVISGRPLTHPDNRTGVVMPPRGGFPNLKDERILEIIAYLRSLQATN